MVGRPAAKRFMLSRSGFKERRDRLLVDVREDKTDTLAHALHLTPLSGARFGVSIDPAATLSG
jgi:hypothetical protein